MRYNSIVYNDTVNGKGMRISLFVQGCNCRCKGCFNEHDSWDFNGGKEFKHTKDIWIWSGHYWEEIIKDKDKLNMVSKCDILIDGRFIESEKQNGLLFRGSKSQRIINIQESLKQNKVILWRD